MPVVENADKSVKEVNVVEDAVAEEEKENN